MKRSILFLVALALSSTALAGCLGDDDIETAIPRAVVKVTKVSDATFTFDATGSTGKGLRYEWNVGDGTTSDQAKFTHEYRYGSGEYPAELLITDLNGVSDIWKETIVVGDGTNAPPEAFFTPSTRYLAVGEPLTVDATLTDDPEGDPISYFWDFNFFISEAEYLQFRQDKKDGVTGGSSDEPQVTNGENKSTLPTVDQVKRLAGLGEKDVGHDGHDSAPPVSLFAGKRQSNEPVFTLEEGFPEPTRFYVKLVAVDVKSASAEILSEEIWPVLVVEKRKQAYFNGTMSGTFTHGSQATVTDNTPDDENVPVDDEYEWKFDIPDLIELMYVNVTWADGPVEAQSPYAVDVDVISPNTKTRAATGADGKPLKIEMTAVDQMGKGTWTVNVYGRNGVNIEWTAEYWAKVDLDPFRALEAPYL